MKKRLLLSIVLILAISLSGVAYAQLETKLTGHWASGEIDKTFMAYYFPYLSKNSFEGFEPNGSITRQDFTLSLMSLFKDRGYEVSGLGDPGVLTRQDMAAAIGSRLLESGFQLDSAYQLPFGDTETMSEQNRGFLSLLHKLGIVKGESNSVFNPLRRLTQAEAVVLMGRLDGAIKKSLEVPFIVTSEVQSYDSKEEMTTVIGTEKVTLQITKEFPTPGYSMQIEKIAREGDLFRIYFKITPPDPEMILPQVITYITITIELEKDKLGEPPYNFVVDGFRSTGESN